MKRKLMDAVQERLDEREQERIELKAANEKTQAKREKQEQRAVAIFKAWLEVSETIEIDLPVAADWCHDDAFDIYIHVVDDMYVGPDCQVLIAGNGIDFSESAWQWAQWGNISKVEYYDSFLDAMIAALGLEAS